MSELLKKMAADGSLTQAQVERIERDVAELAKAAQNDPKLLVELKKLAAPGFLGAIGSNWKPAVGLMMASAGVSAASNMIGDVYRGIKDSINHARYYKAMMDANPHLGQMNAEQVQKAFNTLARFNPDYAGDPSVAGEWVRTTIEMERTPLEAVNGLVQAYKNRQSTGGPSGPRLDLIGALGASRSMPSPLQQHAQELMAQQQIGQSEDYLASRAHRPEQMQFDYAGE